MLAGHYHSRRTTTVAAPCKQFKGDCCYRCYGRYGTDNHRTLNNQLETLRWARYGDAAITPNTQKLRSTLTTDRAVL